MLATNSVEDKDSESLDETKLENLCYEVARLVSYFAKIRSEIAMLYAQHDSHTLIESMQRQLKSVLIKSEAAANETISIFENLTTSCERLGKAISQGQSKDAVEQIKRIHGLAINGLESSTLQDVIRQRVAAIALSMTYIDARVERIADLIGKDKVSQIARRVPPVDTAGISSSSAEAGIGQSEIDAMFP